MKSRIDPRNKEVYKKIFNWCDIQGNFNTDIISRLSQRLGPGYIVKPDEISYKAPYSDDFNITVFRKGDETHKLFYIKRLWEVGSMKEVLGMELARIFDPELCINKYVVGTFRSRFLKREIVYLMTPWIPGRPITEEESIQHAFMMGRHYELARWLCLYDCYPRHYFLQPDGVGIKRIDFGQSFFKLYKEFEGFADIWPKELFANEEFYAGIEDEHNKIRVRAEIAWEEIMNILNEVKKLTIDRIFSFRGPKLRKEILEYWRKEGLVDENYRIPSRYKFLHVVKTTTQPAHAVEHPEGKLT